MLQIFQKKYNFSGVTKKDTPSIFAVHERHCYYMYKHTCRDEGKLVRCSITIPAFLVFSFYFQKEIHRKVEWMMGEATKVMNEKVNCLIAGEVGSKKYLVAGLRKNKIMLPDWVHAVWTDTRYRRANNFFRSRNSYFIFYLFCISCLFLITTY